MVCGNFILPEPASYVFFYALFNLRKLLYIIKSYSRNQRGSAARRHYIPEAKDLCKPEIANQNPFSWGV